MVEQAAKDGITFKRNTAELKSFMISRYVQTIYRDSEAQTEPYSPQYIAKAGEKPEVLALVGLTWKHGLPAGLKEIEMIDRVRERRKKMSKLIDTQTEADDLITHRYHVLREIEMKEWQAREREIEDLQETRLQVLAQLLRVREENHQEIVTKQLDRLWKCRQIQRKNKLQHIRMEYAKAIRKLLHGLEHKRRPYKKDIIDEYADPGSRAFAPLLRNGVFHDQGSERFVVKSHFINTFEGLTSLDRRIPKWLKSQNIFIERPSQFTKDGFLKRNFKWQNDLVALHKHLVSQKRKERTPTKGLRYLEKIPKPLERPTTPTVTAYDPLIDERELAVSELQRMLRGKATQNIMFESRIKRKDLIEELRSTHALLNDDRAEKRRQMLMIRTIQTRYEYSVHDDQITHEVLKRLEGSTLGNMLDFLSKELDRLIVERRLHAFSVRAIRERRMREAEESGQRQKEERRRREQDEYFRQVIKVHQDTVDGYFQSICDATMESTADVYARQEISKIADEWIEELERAQRELTSEEEASDLVYNFVIPEVNRCAYRERLKREERKLLNAAHCQLFSNAQEGEFGNKIRAQTNMLNSSNRQDVATYTNHQLDDQEETSSTEEGI